MIPLCSPVSAPRLFGAILLVTGAFAVTSCLGPGADAQDLSLSVQIAPPALPVYDQPPMPDLGYIWTPGYWSYSDQGYYWVPGTWVEPPEVGMLWTPPYWGWGDGGYRFHAGYWGPQVGYYGGVNYGYGYGGDGYQGGRWQDGRFAYNRSGNNFGRVHVTNVYQERLEVSNRSHVSYAGGVGGLNSQPSAAQRAAEQERHPPATAAQNRHNEAAAAHPGLAASHDNGRPAIAATARPAQFEGAGVVPPRPAPVARPVPQAAAARQAAPQARPQEPRPQEQRPQPAAPREQARPEQPRPQPPRAEQRPAQRPEHKPEF